MFIRCSHLLKTCCWFFLYECTWNAFCSSWKETHNYITFTRKILNKITNADNITKKKQWHDFESILFSSEVQQNIWNIADASWMFLNIFYKITRIKQWIRVLKHSLYTHISFCLFVIDSWYPISFTQKLITIWKKKHSLFCSNIPSFHRKTIEMILHCVSL